MKILNFRFKKYLFVAFLLFFVSYSNTFAQRFAFVDTEYILEHIPEYKSAQQQLNKLSEAWQKEIEKRKEEIDRLYSKYQAEYMLLPEDVRQQRENEIIQKEKELNAFKQEKFGRDGELFKKKEELIKPIQDKVFEAVQQLARDAALDFIFDKAGAITMLFSNPRFDRSDEVLNNLGVKVKQ